MPVQTSPFPVNPVTNKIYVGSMASFGSAITVIDGATNSTDT